MKDAPLEALLRRLGARASERDRADEPVAKPADGSPENPMLEAAQQPLDDAARARIVGTLEAMILEQQAAKSREAEEPETVTRGRFGSVGAWLPVAAVLLIFLAIVLYRAQFTPQRGAQVTALPVYSMSVQGAVQLERSSPEPVLPGAEPYRVAPGNRLRVVLTPEQAVLGALAARAVLVEARGERPVDPALLELSDQGAVRLDALVEAELEMVDRSARLWIVVGEEAALDEALRRVADGAEAGRIEGPGWQAFALDLELVEPP